MRRDPFGVGSFVHVVQRGVRGNAIVRSDDERWRFLKLLRYLNDANVPRNWERDIGPDNIRDGFSRPDHWPKAQPYTSIVAFCLMDNHFHLLLRENIDDGISRFMQRISTSMAAYLNAKYSERGTPFQGSYRARTISDDRHMQYLNAYIHVKNPFERHPRGSGYAAAHFNDAFEWAAAYPFSSLMDYRGRRKAQILDFEVIDEIFESDNDAFKRFAHDMIQGRIHIDDEIERILLT